MTHEARIADLPHQGNVAFGAYDQSVLGVTHNCQYSVEHLFLEQFEGLAVGHINRRVEFPDSERASYKTKRLHEQQCFLFAAKTTHRNWQYRLGLPGRFGEVEEAVPVTRNRQQVGVRWSACDTLTQTQKPVTAACHSKISAFKRLTHRPARELRIKVTDAVKSNHTRKD